MATAPATKSLEHYEFKKQVEALKQFRGRGTELVSVYVTPGYQLSDIVGKLREEAGAATNIKSTATRKNVLGALEKIMQYLKTFKETPVNGMAVFAGNVSDTEGRPDIQLFSIMPPMPIVTQFYRCESQFVLEPLENLVNTTDTYGLVVMDGKEATVAVLVGKQIKVIKQIHSTAHAKTHKGGQSAARFGRLREEGIDFFQQRVGEAMDAFLNYKNLKGVIVGGPGPVKEDFLKERRYNYQLKVIGTVDTSYTDEYGLRELIEKSEDVLKEQEAFVEKQLVDKFLKEAVTNGKATYGYRMVLKAVESNQADRVLISENLKLFENAMTCSNCGKEKKLMSDEEDDSEECECNGKLRTTASRNLVKELEEACEKAGIPVELVSQDTSEGNEFRATFGGIGAFLRYK